MKVSQLINELNHIQNEKGDLDIYVSVDISRFPAECKAPSSSADFVTVDDDGEGDVCVTIKDWPY